MSRPGLLTQSSVIYPPVSFALAVAGLQTTIPRSQDTKDKKQFFDRILQRFMPPSTVHPPISPYPPVNKHASQAEVNDLAATFGRVYISGVPAENREQRSPVFVGGFNLAGNLLDSRMNLPLDSQPPTMPVQQQSLTMMYASQPVDNRSVAARLPPVTPQISARRQAQSRPNATTGSASILSSDSSPSQISSPSGQTCMVQCSGYTKTDKRCTRTFKVNCLIGGNSPKIEHFCFQHKKKVLTNSGFYTKPDQNWVDFDVWICPYLQESTQATLRAEMVRARSAQDEPGYIYTFEIRDPGSKTIRLKVGRATSVVRRLDQWTKQCGSEEQVPRGVYPENVEQDGSSLMTGRIKAGEKAPFCHRLERLIHIELADLASTSVYLEPGWPNIETPPSTSGSPKKTKGKENACNKVCPDCGARHNEIFEFQRWGKGGNQGKEWERVVKPVIERWGKFVELYV